MKRSIKADDPEAVDLLLLGPEGEVIRDVVEVWEDLSYEKIYSDFEDTPKGSFVTYDREFFRVVFKPVEGIRLVNRVTGENYDFDDLDHSVGGGDPGAEPLGNDGD